MQPSTNLLHELFEPEKPENIRTLNSLNQRLANEMLRPISDEALKLAEATLPLLELVGAQDLEEARIRREERKRFAEQKAKKQETKKVPGGRPEVPADQYFSDFTRLAKDFFGDSKYASLFAAVNNHLK